MTKGRGSTRSKRKRDGRGVLVDKNAHKVIVFTEQYGYHIFPLDDAEVEQLRTSNANAVGGSQDDPADQPGESLTLGP